MITRCSSSDHVHTTCHYQRNHVNAEFTPVGTETTVSNYVKNSQTCSTCSTSNLCAFTNFRMLRKSHTAQHPYVFKWQIELRWGWNLFLFSKLNTHSYKNTQTVKIINMNRNTSNHVYNKILYERVQNRQNKTTQLTCIHVCHY